MSKINALVTGASGFIGHHLVKALVKRGYYVRGVDIKMPEYELSDAHEFMVLDLRERHACDEAVKGIDDVYNLAADMGGIGYITSVHADVARHNVLIDVQMLEASHKAGVRRFFFSSSACAYPVERQGVTAVEPLAEWEAYPANPEPAYGWEKLFMEEMCKYYREDKKLSTRIARIHNCFGMLGTYQGGREKAPAALRRKIAMVPDGGTIEVWGDGSQTRSFLYVDDCVEGICRIAQSEIKQPLNLGSTEMVSVNQLIDMICQIAGKRVHKQYDLARPQGVRGRNSDNTLIKKLLGWEPSIRLYDGLVPTYRWIERQVQGGVIDSTGKSQ